MKEYIKRRPTISSSYSTSINPAPDRSAKTERTVAIILLIVITCATYVPVVNQHFSGWDDEKFVAAVWKPSWQRAWRVVTDFDLTYTGEVYYNPLQSLSLMADQLFSTSPKKPTAWVSKLMNVVYHIANSVLVFLLLLMVGTGRRPAFIGALIFALHPIQVGTVAWVAERKNLLATLFYLAAVMLFLKYLLAERTSSLVTDTEAGPTISPVEPASLPAEFQTCTADDPVSNGAHTNLTRRNTGSSPLVKGGQGGFWDKPLKSPQSPPLEKGDFDAPGGPAASTDKRLRYLLGVILCFAASLLSKPSAVTLPVVLAALSVVFGYDQFKRRRLIGPLASLFVMALGWGYYVLLTERTYSGILPAWPYRPFISAGAFWFYISKILLPLKLSPIYPKWDVAGHIPWFSLLLAATIAVAVLVIYFRKQIDRWILWGMLFFALNLVSGFGPDSIWLYEPFLRGRPFLVPADGWSGIDYCTSHLAIVRQVGCRVLFREIAHGCALPVGRGVGCGLGTSDLAVARPAFHVAGHVEGKSKLIRGQ